MIGAKKELVRLGMRVMARFLCIVLISCSIAAAAPVGFVGGALVVSEVRFEQVIINVLNVIEGSLKNAPDGQMRLCERSLADLVASMPCSERLYTFEEVAMAYSLWAQILFKGIFYVVLAIILIFSSMRAVFVYRKSARKSNALVEE